MSESRNRRRLARRRLLVDRYGEDALLLRLRIFTVSSLKPDSPRFEEEELPKLNAVLDVFRLWEKGELDCVTCGKDFDMRPDIAGYYLPPGKPESERTSFAVCDDCWHRHTREELTAAIAEAFGGTAVAKEQMS
jgi:hypothetical protein